MTAIMTQWHQHGTLRRKHRAEHGSDLNGKTARNGIERVNACGVRWVQSKQKWLGKAKSQAGAQKAPEYSGLGRMIQVADLANDRIWNMRYIPFPRYWKLVLEHNSSHISKRRKSVCCSRNCHCRSPGTGVVTMALYSEIHSQYQHR